MRILHLITSLSIGGAETMLRNIVLGLDRGRFQSYVISLIGKEPIGAELEARNIPVLALNGRHGLLLPHQLMRARSVIRDWQPDLIHAWMYHANVVAQLLAAVTPRARRPRVVISVRGALNAPGAQKRTLRLVRRIDSQWSRRATAIVFNSSESSRQHVDIGYDATKMVIVPNGFDTNRFRPRSEDRTRIRTELGVSDQILIGLVARFDVLKGHKPFLEASASVAGDHRKCVFALIGRDCDSRNGQLREWIGELGLSDKVRLLGERRDVPAILNALDIVVCPSISESFPNAVGEAMACAKPCVVTDVGDCAYLVGNTGEVVPPGNVSALATAILQLASLPKNERESIGLGARNRIVAHFSLDAAIGRYAQIYDGVSRTAEVS